MCNMVIRVFVHHNRCDYLNNLLFKIRQDDIMLLKLNDIEGIFVCINYIYILFLQCPQTVLWWVYSWDTRNRVRTSSGERPMEIGRTKEDIPGMVGSPTKIFRRCRTVSHLFFEPNLSIVVVNYKAFQDSQK